MLFTGPTTFHSEFSVVSSAGWDCFKTWNMVLSGNNNYVRIFYIPAQLLVHKRHMFTNLFTSVTNLDYSMYKVN